MKNKLNQDLRTFDLINLVVLAGVVVLLAGYHLLGSLKDDQRLLALSEAESLAFQLSGGGFLGVDMNLTRGKSREISSEKTRGGGVGLQFGLFKNSGDVGKDPWGQPYQYHVIKPEHGKVGHLVVWSPGPDGELDTLGFSSTDFSQRRLGSQSWSSLDEVRFLDDDIGYIHPLDKRALSFDLTK